MFRCSTEFESVLGIGYYEDTYEQDLEVLHGECRPVKGLQWPIINGDIVEP